MAVDYRAELRRPVALGLLAAAVLGWLLLVIVAVTQTRKASNYRRDLEEQRTSLAATRAELDQQRQTSGTLKDLQTKIAAAQQQAAQTEQARAQAQAQAAAAQQAAEQQKRATADAEKAAQEQSQKLAAVQGNVQQAETRLGALKGEVTTVEQSIAARTQELAEVGRRLEDSRQQEAKSREALAKLGQEIAAKTAEIAQAEQRIQQARELEARLQALRQEIMDTEAKLGDARKQLVIPQAPAPEGSAPAATQTGNGQPPAQTASPPPQ
ncbi:MAG TPA: hypothetical protein VH743_02600 [Beijerinckiaceae bacterium]|jgi:chromosome segregation ATPase